MNLKKVWLIISHEYSVRVRKKSFIVITLLTPLLLGLLICLPAAIMLFEEDSQKKIKVFDASGVVAPYLEDTQTVDYQLAGEGETLEVMKLAFFSLDCYALLDISPLDSCNEVSVVTYSAEPLSLDLKQSIGNAVNKAVRDQKLKSYGIENIDRILDDVRTDIPVESITISEQGGEKKDNVELYMIVAYVMSFLIYTFVFIFGSMVMRSVIDEKSSRVVEVLVSSVKSVELMMGKIIGVALVALTQFCIWVALTAAIAAGTAAALSGRIAEKAAAGMDGSMPQFLTQVLDFNWGPTLSCFVVYFLLGYLLYAAMFAAIGAAVDNETDTSQLQLPVTIPLVVGLFIMLHTFEHPSSQLSVWASIIPFTSPMVMPARVPFGNVPGWEIALSTGLLLLTFIAVAWVSAKIYKVGILTYGKKTGFKDLMRWLRQKN